MGVEGREVIMSLIEDRDLQDALLLVNVAYLFFYDSANWFRSKAMWHFTHNLIQSVITRL